MVYFFKPQTTGNQPKTFFISRRRMVYGLWSTVYGLWLFTGVASAADISIAASLDRDRMTINETVTLTVVISGATGRIPEPQFPPLADFTAYSSGRAQNISVHNTQVFAQVTFTYILVPNATGKKTIGPIRVTYDGQTYSTEPLEIEVTDSGPQGYAQAPSSRGPSSQPSLPQTGDQEQGRAQEMFIETYVDNLTPYVNEQVTLTFAFYQAVQLFDNPVYTPPSTTGFWAEDMPPQNKYYKVINGRRYLVTEIKTALFPTAPGQYVIGPARLEASVDRIEDFFRRSAFDIFDRDPMSIFRRGQPVILTTDPITLEVKALPEQGRPRDFAGAVGQYDMSVKADRLEVQEGDPVTLTISIEGRGNIRTLSDPVVSVPDMCKVYDSGSSEEVTKNNYVVGGKKTFQKVLIPKSAGTATLEPLTYHFFNPRTKEYGTITTQPIAINVTVKPQEALQATGPVVPSLTYTEKKEIALIATDIRYIKTELRQMTGLQTPLYRNRLFIYAHLLSPLILFICFVDARHRRKLTQDVRYARLHRAHKVARKRLKKALQRLKEQDSGEAVYREVYRAITEYIADRLNLSASGMTTIELCDTLRGRGVSEELIHKTKKLLEECDLMRFTDVKQDRGRFTQSVNEAEDIIVSLERIRI
ncbi:MAG: protein BatD [Candidatus Omnitrophica bacterium]|nr:protein BatD [Candidatus Omnitrophota bacterium]